MILFSNHDSELFLVSAPQHFGVENEHIILLPDELDIGEQWALRSPCKQTTTAVFLEGLDSVCLLNEMYPLKVLCVWHFKLKV